MSKNLKANIQAEIIVRQLAVAAVNDRIKRAEREARKENRPIPRSEMDKLQDDLKFARGNVNAAQVSLEAVCKYPPCAR